MPPRIPLHVRIAISKLHDAGLSQREIATRVGVNKRAVNRIVQAYRDEGRIEDAPRGAPPNATSADEDLLVVAAIADDPFLTVPELKRCLNLNASAGTIKRRLQMAGIRCRVTGQKPRFLRHHRDSRLAFAQEHRSWGREQWAKVIFSGEASFCSRWDGQRRTWRPAYCRYDPEYIKQVESSGRCILNVWSCVSHLGLGPLHRIDGLLTAQQYVEILGDVMMPFALDGPFPDGVFLFQDEERSTIHRADVVQQFLQEREVGVLQWPPEMWDLNVIEDVWTLLTKLELRRRRLEDSSTDTLWTALSGAWQRLREQPHLVASLYDALPGRVDETISADGGHIPAETSSRFSSCNESSLF